jgi:hypothetical protein
MDESEKFPGRFGYVTSFCFIIHGKRYCRSHGPLRTWLYRSITDARLVFDYIQVHMRSSLFDVEFQSITLSEGSLAWP